VNRQHHAGRESWVVKTSCALAWAAGLLILLGCGALITIDVITRAIFRRGMVESFELSGYALAGAVGLGLAFTVTSKSNIRVDILLDMLPNRLRRPLDMLAAVELAVVAVALAWHAWGTVSQSWGMGARWVSSL
jgi:TRAP-type C4-dicarboxylate transport system permease small subunit